MRSSASPSAKAAARSAPASSPRSFSRFVVFRDAASYRRATEIAFAGVVMREYVWLECTVCGSRNYRTEKETRGANRLELKKFCRKERRHTAHKESRKK